MATKSAFKTNILPEPENAINLKMKKQTTAY